MSDNNILDKIIKQNKEQKLSSFNPRELIDYLLSGLSQREREIINARYGLESPHTKTLEAIGQKYHITRERVRQIEKKALKKALAVSGWQDKLADLSSFVTAEIKKSGYLHLEERLFDKLLHDEGEEREINKNRLRFIFTYFLADYIEPVDIVHTERAWKIKGKNLEHYQQLIEGVKQILIRKEEPLHLSEIIDLLKKGVGAEKIDKIVAEIGDWEEAVKSYLEVSKHFKNNLFDKWGLAHWRSVSPKRMRDKIYLVLQKYNQPMHFREITDKINQEKFDNKIAHPATIHNELILDERFVLVGRGIYALKEWGYKPGMIVDVVRQILQEQKTPLTKSEIIKEVLKHRLVKEGSINLALSNRKYFIRLDDGRYALKA